MREGKSSSVTLSQEPEQIAPTEREMHFLPKVPLPEVPQSRKRSRHDGLQLVSLLKFSAYFGTLEILIN